VIIISVSSADVSKPAHAPTPPNCLARSQPPPNQPIPPTPPNYPTRSPASPRKKRGPRKEPDQDKLRFPPPQAARPEHRLFLAGSPASPKRGGAHAGGVRARHVNPKISPVDRILPAPWGLSGGNWWLPLSHRVVGAPKPPSVTSVSGQETTSSVCDHGGEAPRRVRRAVQKSSPPPLRPRARFNNPPGPPCAAGVSPGGPGHPWPCPAASPIIAIQTWRIGEAWSGPYDRTDCMMVLSPKFTCGTNRRERMAHTQ
jgi:hypothetical protein